jgi:hypothetical protein
MAKKCLYRETSNESERLGDLTEKAWVLTMLPG